MTVRMQARFNSRPTEDLIAYYESYQQIANEEMDKAVALIAPPALDELSYEPGPVKYPIEWTSEKQRRAFFATNGFGRGIGAARTHDLSKSWGIVKNTFGNDIMVTFDNPTPYAKFVVGSLAKGNPGGFMQQMHKNTGWHPAYETVDFWMVALTEQFTANMRARLGDTMSGATTVRTRAWTG